jgi:tetratricopeptide (TPR) repeat protein/tRNA A-37 threonylcarbamoyl transferase component Bud32
MLLSSLQRLQDGRYTLLKKLGEGGKGLVYKARDTVLNRVVAIKMLKTAVSSEEAYSRFMREAQAVAKLNHPNIVSIYDIGKEDGKQFFVLEFVDGMSLRDLMKTYPGGKLDAQTVLRIVIDVCSALHYAHSQGVLHRDIKPENILVTEEGVAKLMDFGLAKMLGEPSITQEGIIVGTVAYVAPENALGKGADVKSDLYSFGAVLYEMVTGKPPFSGEDPVKIIFSHVHDYPTSPNRLSPEVPQALTDCIMKLLEKEPGKRFQNAALLLEELKAMGEDLLRETLVPSRKTIAVVPPLRPSGIKEIQLVNRYEEMTILREAVDKTVRGEGGLVFLYGEAGIGKTRLARELGAYARLRGMQVLYGRCPALFRMDGVPPYVLWNEVIKDYLQVCTPEQLYKVIGYYPGEVCKLVPEVRQKLGMVPQSLPISPEHERDRFFEAVSQFIVNVSKEAPLMVVLDDLQWTDQSSLLLLHYLVRGVQKEHLLLLGDYRDTDIDERHPLTPVLNELNRERLLQSVRLKRMSLHDICEMIKGILEQDEVPSGFCEMVFEKTRGNPFFAEEVIKSLMEEGIVYRERNKWIVRELSKIEFPKTVKSVVKSRLSRLDDECQSVLIMASFVGKDFAFEVLREVTGIEEEKLLQVMERILKTELVKEKVIRGKDVYSFADAIVKDVMHEEISHLRHKKLHNSVGLALERAYANKIDEHFGELAYHFLEGGNSEKALDYFLKGGEKAEAVYAHGEASSYLQHALTLIEEKEGEVEDRARVTERLGDIKSLVGEIDSSLEWWNKSLMLWSQLENRKDVSRVHVKMARLLWERVGEREKASKHHQAALDILGKEPESEELANLYEDISHMLWRSGDYARAESFTQKALKVAEKLQDFDVLAESYNDLGVIRFKSADFENAIVSYEKGLAIAKEHNCTVPALRLHHNLCLAYWSQGEFQKAHEVLQRGFEFAKKVGEVHTMTWMGILMAWGNAFTGDIQKAFALLEEILTLNKRLKDTVNIAQILSSFGGLYMYSGEWEKSLQHLLEARELAKKIGEYQFDAEATLWLGELLMEMEDYDQAEKYFKESRSMCEKTQDKESLFTANSDLSRLHLKKEELEQAEQLVEEAHAFAMTTKNRVYLAEAEMLEGMLLREQKNWPKSKQHFEKSLQTYKDLNAQKWYVFKFAELLYEYGLMYLSRKREKDRENAYSLLDQALDIYRRVDAKKKVERIIAKKRLLTA